MFMLLHTYVHNICCNWIVFLKINSAKLEIGQKSQLFISRVFASVVRYNFGKVQWNSLAIEILLHETFQQSAAETFGVIKSLWLENSIEPFQKMSPSQTTSFRYNFVPGRS